MITNERIKKLRKELKFSQQKVADILGISRPSYSRKENGKNNISANERLELCNNLIDFHTQDKLLKIKEMLTDYGSEIKYRTGPVYIDEYITIKRTLKEIEKILMYLKIEKDEGYLSKINVFLRDKDFIILNQIKNNEHN